LREKKDCAMRWKWIFLISSLLVVLLFLTAYTVLSSYDFNRFKPEIVQKVREATGRELTLGGDIRVDFGFIPSLSVTDVSLSNASWGSRKALVKIKGLHVQMALLPLIKGEIKFRRLVILEPDILLETDPNGRFNLEFETGENGKTAQPGRRAQTSLPPFAFHKILIEKGLLTYRDGRSGKSYSVHLSTLTAAEADRETRVEMALKGTLNGKPFELEGSCGHLVSLVNPDEAWPLKLTLETPGAKLHVKGTVKDAFKAKGLALSISAEGPSIPAVAQWAGVTGAPDLGPFRADLKVGDPEGKLAVQKLEMALGSYEVAEFKATGSVVDLLGQRGLKLSFTVRGRELADLQKAGGRPLPFKGPFSISGRVASPQPRTYGVTDMKAVFGENDLTGSAELNLSGKRPLLNVALSSKKFDLRPLLPKTGKSKGTNPAGERKTRGKVFSDVPLPLGRLTEVDGRLEVRMEQLLLPHLALDRFTADIRLKDGRLLAKPVESGGGASAGSARSVSAPANWPGPSNSTEPSQIHPLSWTRRRRSSPWAKWPEVWHWVPSASPQPLRT
jgi:uncharacterized protein involved in outer membrane biogenesis